MVDEQPIEVDIDRALLLGQTFFLIDAFVAWCITGGLVVQFISYTAALKTTLSRERRWQIWVRSTPILPELALTRVFSSGQSINILLFLTVSQTLVNVWRLINLEVVHYGNQDFADHYRGRPTGAIVFYLQLVRALSSPSSTPSARADWCSYLNPDYYRWSVFLLQAQATTGS